MAYSIEYFHAKVQDTIEAWPVNVVADYARIVEFLIEHGSNLRFPHSRAPLVVDCLNYARAVNRVLGERSIAFLSGAFLSGSAW